MFLYHLSPQISVVSLTFITMISTAFVDIYYRFTGIYDYIEVMLNFFQGVYVVLCSTEAEGDM